MLLHMEPAAAWLGTQPRDDEPAHALTVQAEWERAGRPADPRLLDLLARWYGMVAPLAADTRALAAAVAQTLPPHTTAARVAALARQVLRTIAIVLLHINSSDQLFFFD